MNSTAACNPAGWLECVFTRVLPLWHLLRRAPKTAHDPTKTGRSYNQRHSVSGESRLCNALHLPSRAQASGVFGLLFDFGDIRDNLLLGGREAIAEIFSVHIGLAFILRHYGHAPQLLVDSPSAIVRQVL